MATGQLHPKWQTTLRLLNIDGMSLRRRYPALQPHRERYGKHGHAAHRRA